MTDTGLEATEPFYVDLLGFEVQGRPGNAFLALGVTDHRALLVLADRFGAGGAEPVPGDAVRLVGVDLLLPAAEDVRAPAGRLAAAGHPHALSAFLYSGTKVAPLVPSVSFGS